ncbi:mucin-16 [Strix uralensis]|uniref:mucin-16 n=1 Tax=Strix uralensis TaxID=36305 RepID=UPI003DA6E535
MTASASSNKPQLSTSTLEANTVVFSTTEEPSSTAAQSTSTPGMTASASSNQPQLTTAETSTPAAATTTAVVVFSTTEEPSSTAAQSTSTPGMTASSSPAGTPTPAVLSTTPTEPSTAAQSTSTPGMTASASSNQPHLRTLQKTTPTETTASPTTLLAETTAVTSSPAGTPTPAVLSSSTAAQSTSTPGMTASALSTTAETSTPAAATTTTVTSSPLLCPPRACATHHFPSVLLAALTHPPTTAAALQRFTINFTITNLPHSSDLATPNSAKFNTTRRVMVTLLDRLLKESSIGPAFLGCETTAFRPVRQGDNTGVDAVCTYRKEPAAPPLDRVGLYREVTNKTRGTTQLGPYRLDRDSLYVNGYNEQPVLPAPTHPPTTAAALQRFTINFTITNLPHSSDLATPNSAKFNTTRRVMVTLLDRLLKESSIGPAFLGCETTAFRPVRQGDNTGVDAVCTYRKEPVAPPLDRVGLYREVTNKTRGTTQLGPYRLDRDSLYVNGYNEQQVLPAPTHPPTTAAALQRFTINFTITNLPHSSDLATPNSAKFNTTRRVMVTLLDRLLKESSIGPAFLGCETTAFRPVRQGDNTGVDAVCTYRKEPAAPPLDRVGLYREVTNKTRGTTQLGPYRLDRDSLYVNGYNEQPVLPAPTHPPTTAAALQRFTINFTITNLPHSSDLATPNSAKFNTTRRVMVTLLDRLLKESSIGPAFLGCETTAFRPVRQGDNTGVDAVCTYRKEPAAPPLDRVGLYREVTNKTRGTTQLGPYRLDRDSLYVNGYNEQPVLPAPTHPPTTAAALQRFTINFTITNLPHSSDLATPNSAKFNTTRRVMVTLLDRLLKESSIGPAFLGCETTAFRPVRQGDNTGVDAVCTYRKEPAAPPLDRVGLYREVTNKTRGTTQLGPYRLDRDSLYVNGYNEQPVLPAPTHPPTTAAALQRFTINFTITNLPHSSDLATPNSAKFNTTRRVMVTLLDRLLKESSIGPAFLGCETTAFRPVRQGDNTGVDAVCTYRKEPAAPPLDRVGLYREVTNKTRGTTQLGPYRLDRDSLYVNGYNEQPVLPAPTHPPTTAAALQRFTINFTITNLPHSSDLATPNSAKFNTTRRVMVTLLDRLLKESSIGPAFLGCETTAFRPVRQGDNTGVDAVCTYRKEPAAPPLDRVGLYREVTNKTRGTTQLGPYRLDRDSLYVNGYNEQPVLPAPTHPPTTAAALQRFTINFTITNLPHSSDLATPNSAKFNTTRRVMVTLLDRLLKESSIGPAFLGCETTAFRPVRQGDNTGVDAVCTYRKEPAAPPLDRVGLYREVTNKTRGTTQLGPYRLDRDSLYVNGYNEQPVLPAPTHPPTTAAALQRFTINFTITNLPHSSDLATPNSAKFNTTRRVMVTLLDRLLKESSIGPAFLGCETTAFRPVRQGDNTGVDAVCTYRKEPAAPPLDRVGLYREVTNKTRGTTQLGPYRLDRDSLYVNGYNEQQVLPAPTHPPTTAAALQRFTINFTITNLPHSSDLATPNSAKFNTTRRVMVTLLDRLLKESSIGPAFLGCETTAFRPVRQGDNTGVDAVCTYRKEPAAPPLDRVGLYREVTNKTRGTTQLGPYRLDRDSLYVNGYNEQPVLPAPTHPPTTAAALQRFTINFTITNLPHSSDLATPNSAKFNTTRRVMVTLLDRLLKESSIGPAFLGCETTAFRPVRQGDNTGVDAVCTYRKEPAAPPLDRVGLYREVTNKTRGTTQLGPYRLDRDSLYVNGYNEQPVLPAPTHPPTTAAALQRFTINFTITNLPHSSDLATPNSAKFNTTRRVMVTLLDRLLKESSIGPAFLGCETTAFRPVRQGDNTGVDAVCTYRKEPAAPPLDRVGLYREVTNKTRGTTQLGPYRLDRDSLYVNGYNEQPVLPAAAPSTPLAREGHFTVNFTVTNLLYTPALGNPNSKKFIATKKTLTYLLDRVLKNSSISPAYAGCAVVVLRSVKNREGTAMDAVCTYSTTATTSEFDRIKVYREFSKMTASCTELGPYRLDAESFYVNGYNELQPELSVDQSTQPLTPSLRNFTLNFTITNLQFTADLVMPNSKKFKSTEKVMYHYVDTLLQKSSIGPAYVGCKVMAFRSKKDRDDTGVDAICSYREEPSGPQFNRVVVYHELSNMTNGITKLGHYSLDSRSLYVNGNETTSSAWKIAKYLKLVKPTTTQSPGPVTEQFTLNFTITNLRFTTDLGTPNSARFNSTEKIMQHYFAALFRKSSIGPYFTGCKVTGFRSPYHYNKASMHFCMKLHDIQFLRSVKNRDNTGVDTICSYGNGSQVPKFDQAKVYQELRSMTNSITKLGIYNLDSKSLYINGKCLIFSFLQALEQSGITSGLRDHFNIKKKKKKKLTLRRRWSHWSLLHNLCYNKPLERSSLSITTAPSPTFRHFTLNFTLTNLQHTPDLDATGSQKFISTAKVINHYIDPLFKRSSISSAYTGCKVMRFRSGRDRGDTGVDAVCSYKNNISLATFDRKKVYHELSIMTNDVTKLGHYSLEKNSLYVDGFDSMLKQIQHDIAILGAFPFFKSYKFLENFIVTLYNMNQLYHQSNLRDQFLNCSITRLRTGSIVVDCKCFFQPEPSINQAVVERAFQDGTSNATGLWLGSSYQLQGFSVDSLELAIEAVTYKTPLKSGKETFRLNFRISNLPYSPELQDSRSQVYQVNKEKIEKELDVFRTSNLKDYFAGCTLESFGPVRGKAYTNVASICKFTLDPFSRTLQKQEVYEELKRLTQGFTKLGPSYELEEQSLVVEGYSPLKTDEQESERSGFIQQLRENFVSLNIPETI